LGAVNSIGVGDPLVGVVGLAVYAVVMAVVRVAKAVGEWAPPPMPPGGAPLVALEGDEEGWIHGERVRVGDRAVNVKSGPAERSFALAEDAHSTAAEGDDGPAFVRVRRYVRPGGGSYREAAGETGLEIVEIQRIPARPSLFQRAPMATANAVGAALVALLAFAVWVIGK
jgi:hypothetical protein